MNRTILKTAFREIRRSFGRFLSITCIIALGVGFFAGLKSTRPDMIATAGRYLEDHAFFDYRLLNSLGFDRESVTEAENSPFVAKAEGAYFADAVFEYEGEETVCTVRSLPDSINTLHLIAGRLAETENECVADGRYFGEDALGKTMTTVFPDDGSQPVLKEKSFTIVGIANSPLYLNHERGTTSLGKGTVSSFLYVTPDAFQSEYYSELYLILEGRPDSYSDEYNDFAKDKENEVSSLCETLSLKRFETIQKEAEQSYADNLGEYERNAADFTREKEEAEQALIDARQTLDTKTAKLEENRQKLQSGKEEYAAGLEKLTDAKKTLADGENQLDQAIGQAEEAVLQPDAVGTELESLTNRLSELEEQQKTLAKSEETLRKNIDALEEGLRQTQQAAQQTNQAKEELLREIARCEALPEAEREPVLTELQKKLNEAEAAIKALNRKQAELQAGKSQTEQKQAELQTAKETLQNGVAQINKGIEQASEALRQIESAKNTLTILYQEKDELNQQKARLTEQERILEESKQNLDSGEKQLAEGQTALQKAEEEYRVSQKEADQKFADAERGLQEGKEKLDDARKQIDDLQPPENYTLSRETNIGYVCFDNDSSIVNGLAEVFPIFFFLVAAMMCMTTMIRMVDDQRTDIGTMKALGYSKTAIMFKYLFYSGLAAVLGCAGGFFAGSLLFPKAIWKAYEILYGFAPLHLIYSPAIALGTLLVSLLCTIGTTVYVCRGELNACAAQIMRPKAPKNGKRTFLERFRFFGKLKFLQKVSIRNIARYKRRLFMMVLGIGGCTALLITGFGIRDSIQKIADYQYSEILLYDCSAAFSDNQTEENQRAFTASLNLPGDSVLFAYEASCDISTPEGIRTAYVVAPSADAGKIGRFIDLEKDGKPVAYPGKGCAVVTKKFAKTNQIKIGSSITVTDADHRQTTLKVTGICENYVYNYIYTTLDSLGGPNGDLLPLKTAFINLPDGEDLYRKAAEISDQPGVANVTVCDELLQRIDNMLRSVDSIVLLLIACAGALAFVVIYNLTNINITERIREIATIKVLGFYPKETAAYVFGENLVLTAFGAFAGIWLGKALHAFVLSKINIDMVSFNVRITLISYLLSVLLTFVFSAAVDFFMYFKLQKIDMAQSLKSIE